MVRSGQELLNHPALLVISVDWVILSGFGGDLLGLSRFFFLFSICLALRFFGLGFFCFKFSGFLGFC